MIPETNELLIPNYDEIIDMKNHFPEMNTFISRKEKEYKEKCASIDASNLTDEEKKITKNTYYIYLIIIKRILLNNKLTCNISISGIEYKEISIDGSRYKFEFDYTLLNNLIKMNDLNIETYYGDGYLSSDLTVKTNERVSK